MRVKETISHPITKWTGTIGTILGITIGGFNIDSRLARVEQKQIEVLKLEQKIEIIHENNQRIYNHLLNSDDS